MARRWTFAKQTMASKVGVAVRLIHPRSPSMKVGAIPLAIYRYGDGLVSGLHRRTFGCYKCCPQATLLVSRLCDAGPDPTKPFLELVGVYPVIEDLHS